MLMGDSTEMSCLTETPRTGRHRETGVGDKPFQTDEKPRAEALRQPGHRLFWDGK